MTTEAHTVRSEPVEVGGVSLLEFSPGGRFIASRNGTGPHPCHSDR
jgi:hypothetical protein